ncbi:hypothetical protein OROHE_014126 [Orobanche hederae]
MAVFMERPPPFRSIPQAPIASTDSSRLLILSANAYKIQGEKKVRPRNWKRSQWCYWEAG